jgi:hypothetical protein
MSDALTGPAIDAVAKLALKGDEAQVLDLNNTIDDNLPGRVFLVHNSSLVATDVTDTLLKAEPTPRARTGTTEVAAVDSFIAYIHRFKEPNSVIFANKAEMKLTTIFDYHDRLDAPPVTKDPDKPWVPMPRWGRFRSVFAFPQSRAYQTWTGKNKVPMGQAEFAEFLEENILDLFDPAGLVLDPEAPGASSDENIRNIAGQLGLKLGTPNEVLTVSRGLSLKSEETVTGAINLTTGEMQVSYAQQNNSDEKSLVVVPSGFIIALPIFEGGGWYKLLVRLRYRKVEQKIKWHFDVFQLTKAFEVAFAEECAAVSSAVDLPLFYGKPPAAQ